MTDTARPTLPPIPDLPVQTLADISPDGFNYAHAIRVEGGWLAATGPNFGSHEPHVWPDADVQHITASHGTWRDSDREAIEQHKRAVEEALSTGR